MEKEWSKEYAAYAKAHGNAPEKQFEIDEETWAGGCMCGFILWMSEALALFRKAHPECFIGYTISDHKAKIKFLENCTHTINTIKT
jgi:hypothetical protein